MGIAFCGSDAICYGHQEVLLMCVCVCVCARARVWRQIAPLPPSLPIHTFLSHLSVQHLSSYPTPLAFPPPSLPPM